MYWSWCVGLAAILIPQNQHPRWASFGERITHLSMCAPRSSSCTSCMGRLLEPVDWKLQPDRHQSPSNPTAHEHLSLWCLLCTANVSAEGPNIESRLADPRIPSQEPLDLPLREAWIALCRFAGVDKVPRREDAESARLGHGYRAKQAQTSHGLERPRPVSRDVAQTPHTVERAVRFGCRGNGVERGEVAVRVADDERSLERNATTGTVLTNSA